MKTEKKEELLKALQEGACVVSYKKIEGPETGSIRNMECTLSPDIIPTHTKVKQDPSSDHLLVWCIDREKWRSVRASTIQKWERVNTS